MNTDESTVALLESIPVLTYIQEFPSAKGRIKLCGGNGENPESFVQPAIVNTNNMKRMCNLTA